MDADGLAEIQRDEERAISHGDLAALAAREERYDIHTAIPAIVQSFDSKTLTVKVQPAIKRLWREAGFLPLPELVDCPVQFPRFGGFVMIGPVSTGDEGLIHFAERAIDNWWHAGGVQEPSEMRLHDLSDGFFAPGYFSKPGAEKVTGGAPADALEIRTLDGKTLIRLKTGAVELGADAAALTPILDGVVHGRGIDPFTGAPYYALGNTSAIVAAKK